MRCSIALREHYVVSNIHGGLDVKRNGSYKAIVHSQTEADAIGQGRILGKIELTWFIIHGKARRIQRYERHVNDSYSLRG